MNSTINPLQLQLFRREMLGNLTRFGDFLTEHKASAQHPGPWLKYVNLATERELGELYTLHSHATFAGDLWLKRRDRWPSDRAYYIADAAIDLMRALEQIARRDYAERRSLKFFKRSYRCAHIVAGRRTCPLDRGFVYHSTCSPPRTDHPELFRRSDGRLHLVYQPYANPEYIQGENLEEFERELAGWAANFGLASRVSAEESWHFPGHTVLCEVWKEAV